MSVVPMKLLTFAGPLDQFDRVVRECVVNQQFHPEQALQLMRGIRGLRPLPPDNPYAPLLRRAENLLGPMNIQPGYAPFEEDESLSAESAQTYLDGLEERLAQFRQRREQLAAQAADTAAVAEQLKNMKGVTVELQRLLDLDYVRFRYGYLPRENFDTIQDTVYPRNNVIFIPTDVGAKQVYGIYFTTKGAREQVDSLFNSLRFTRIMLDKRMEGTVEEALQNLEAQKQAAAREQAALDEELSAFQKMETGRFTVCWSYLQFQNGVCDVRRYAACSMDSFYLMGWVPRDCVQALCDRAGQIPGLQYVLDDAGDAKNTTPPTKLKNSLLARMFQPFLTMYGLPNYKEVDPSLFMAVTYVLFFGIMFGDIGQGLVLALVGLYLGRVRKMALGNIITCCGLAGAIFGCVYGSVFGFEDLLPGFKILEGANVATLLVISLGLGVVMIVFVMALNIVNGIRQRNWDKILFGPNGAAGMVFYLGIIVAALALVLFHVNLFRLAYVLPVLVLPLVLILLRGPLTKLLSGDPTWRQESIGSVVGLGFFELFETLLSYLTNTLSFLRVAAYAVTHVGLMLVVQSLAGANLNPVVLVLGNIFVIGFEGLLVGIQVLRLEFYELFGRFYDDGGLAYSPKIIDYTGKNQ